VFLNIRGQRYVVVGGGEAAHNEENIETTIYRISEAIGNIGL
jgi:hypothetical protein